MPKDKTRKPCPNKIDNENVCPCVYVDCVRHGVCCDCLQFHKLAKEPTACVTGFRNGFTEKELEEAG